MITFKNIAGNKFLAVGTIQRKSALNGEKSLTGTLYDGDDVLNKIDKGWSLEFDNEPYIVTYFERNDNDNSVSFDAIHKFFWDMAKNVLYSETSGSHTIKWYLDQIFANTGYSYALNFNPNAIAKDNWGMKNKLSLFNDVITSIEGEFEINGTLVSIFKNIGTDLSTIVRYGFNLSDMTIENDASGFVTYGEGFGAYADQDNMTGDRLHVTYTSPLASVYGKLQAEPIDDQRYTIESNLLDAVKSQVDASFSISVNLSLYDLSVAGYPYKMANVGDWLTAVDENLDFKQRIRIISIDDEFAADGTRISYSVTAGDIGLTKKYQDANASIVNKVEDAVISAGQAATDANIALIAANGKNKSYHLNDINDLPKTANEGDLAWVQSGDGRVLYIYTKKADGTYYWEKRIDPEMGEQIEAGVNEAIAQANENTATAIEQNNVSQQEVMNNIAKSQADLAIKDGDFNNKAQAMADKALADAKSNTTQVAQDALNSANQNIADAKKSVTDDIAREASDRASAVNALDTKAKVYVDAAKKDVLETVNKEITDRQNAVTALDTKAQGYANTAKTDALNALTKEVTNRQNAVSELDTKSTNAVNQAKSDINDTINSLSVGGRNYLLNSNGSTLDKWTPVNGWSIISDADRGNVFTFTPTTSWTGGSTNSLSQTRTDFPKNKTVTVSFWAKASVDGAKFHSEPTGGNAAANSVLNVSLKTNWQRYSYTFYLSAARIYFMPVDSGVTYWVDDLQLEIGNMISDYSQAPEDIVYDYTDKDNQIKQTFTQYQQSNDGNVSKAQTDATQALGLVATKVSQTDFDTKTGDLTTKYTQVKQTTDSQATDIVDIKKTATSQASKINSISSDVDGTKQSISDIETTQDSQSDKINQITSDVNGTKQSITDIQTKDGQQDTRMGTIETSVSGVKSDFSTYKADANGRISTAQTTAQTAVDGLKNKVSQTDYNTKTGQLQTDLTTTTQTANQAKIDIVSIKQTDTSQDSRMNTIESDANGTKQTVSQLQTVQGQQSGSISTLQQRADGFDATVTKVNNLAVGGRNLLINTSNAQSGYPIKFANTSIVSGTTQKITFPSVGETCITKSATGETYYRFNVPTSGNMVNIVAGKSYTFSADLMGNVPYLALRHQNQSGGASWTGDFKSDLGVTTTYKRVSITFTVPKNATGFYLSLQAYSDSALTNTTITDAQYFSFKRVKFEEGTIATSYEYAPEDVDSATAKAQLTADNATLSINNYKADADGRISKVQSDIVTNANSISTKVSQSDYNTKTSDLTTQLNATTTTATQSKQDIADIKTKDTSQDARMTTIESDASGTKTTVSNLQKTQDTQVGNISTLQQRADGFDADVETINGATAKAQLTADNATTALANYKTDADGRITKAQSDVTQTAALIATKVSQSDYNAKTGQLSTDVSNAQQTANSAVTTIGSYKTTNDNRVTAAETKISQNASDILLRAAKTDLDAAKQDYSTQISQVKVDVNSVSTTVSSVKAQVDGLQFTNINMLDNSGFEMPLSSTTGTISIVDGSNSTRPVPFGKYMALVDNLVNTVANDLYGAFFFNNQVNLKANTQYTISYYYSVAGTAGYQHSDYALDANGKIIFGIAAEHATTDVTGGQMVWKRFAKTFTLSDDAVVSGLRIGFVSNVDGRGWKVVDNIKIEIGNKATDYSPSPYDNDYKFASQQVTIDGITNTVSNQGSSINSLTTRVQTAEGNISTATNSITNMQSTITQTTNQITQEIADRKTEDTNILQSSKDFTTSSITDSENGTKSLITQTSDSIIAQIGNTNLIPNSEFDPLNKNWYAVPAVGATIGNALSLTKSGQFMDRSIINGSRGILYSGTQWIISEPTIVQAGKAVSISICAGRSDTTNGSSATLDFGLALFDSNKQYLRNTGSLNPIFNVTYKDLQKYVIENISIPSDAYYVSIILKHSSNVSDSIYQPMINYGARSTKYSPTFGTSASSTVLSLFKDNWSIGISDNIGAITSGIVGNNNSMSLISKNVIIDSPSTQITGTAWINSAMIKDGSIGTAQIGDASITSAKIIDLDVSRLTGNTTQFIKSNWDSAYGNVSIDPDSILLNAKSGSTMLTSVSIGSLGMKIAMPGVAGFLSDTMINSGGISFQHAGGTYGSFGMLGNGFTTQYSPTGGAPLGITVGDGKNNDAADMAFGISVTQNSGSAPQLIWAGASTGKVSSSYRTWDNPAGFIIADNIKFSTWDNTASKVEIDDTVNFYNYAPIQLYGMRFSDGTTRELHLGGKDFSSGAKWFGFLDGVDQAGFGTDNTGDVMFFMKGQVYSLYTMLGKLGMR